MLLPLHICVHPKRIHRIALGCDIYMIPYVYGITLCIILHVCKPFPDVRSFYVFSGFEGIAFYLLDALLVNIRVVWCFAFNEANLLWSSSHISPDAGQGPFSLLRPRNVMLSGLFACSPWRNKPHTLLGQSAIHLFWVIEEVGQFFLWFRTNLDYFEGKLDAHWNFMFPCFYSFTHLITWKFLVLVHWGGRDGTDEEAFTGVRAISLYCWVCNSLLLWT